MSHSPALGGALRRPSLLVAAGGAAVALGVALWRLRGRGWRSGPTGFAAKAAADAVQAPGYRFSDPEVRWGIIGVGDVCEVKVRSTASPPHLPTNRHPGPTQGQSRVDEFAPTPPS